MKPDSRAGTWHIKPQCGHVHPPPPSEGLERGFTELKRQLICSEWRGEGEVCVFKCLCAYMCVLCVHVRALLCIYVIICVCTHVCEHVCTCECGRTCTCVSTRARECVNTHGTCVRVHTDSTCVSMRVCEHVYTCMCSCIFVGLSGWE